MTWAHLEKKGTRLRTYTKSHDDFCKQWLETALTLQKIVSQLAILSENISQEDLNLNFLRSLHSERNTHVVVWRNKPDLDTMSFDDLYNNFKIVEQEIKGTANSSSSSNFQNMTLVSSPSSTNEVNTGYGVSIANTQANPASTQVNTTSTQVSTANLSDATIYMAEDEAPTNMALIAFSDFEIDLSNSGLEELQQPEFEGYRPKINKNVIEDIPNEVKESHASLSVKDRVLDNKDCLVESPVVVEKKAVVPTIAKVEVVRPKQPRPVNTVRPNLAVVNVVRVNQGYPQKVQEDPSYVDSGCSRHMTGNMSYLSDFIEFDGGYVTFRGGANGGRITGKLTTAIDVNAVEVTVPGNFTAPKTIRDRRYGELTDVEKIHEACKIKETNIVLQGLPQDIYNLANHHDKAKHIWDRFKLLIEGSEISLQERESKLYDEFDMFTLEHEETIYLYYLRQFRGDCLKGMRVVVLGVVRHVHGLTEMRELTQQVRKRLSIATTDKRKAAWQDSVSNLKGLGIQHGLKKGNLGKGYLLLQQMAFVGNLSFKKLDELAIPRQTTTGKESSDPFMAGSLPKTIHFFDSLQSDVDSFELIELMILCTNFLTMVHDLETLKNTYLYNEESLGEDASKHGRIYDADAEVTFINETSNDARNKNSKISNSKRWKMKKNQV
nr:hypothetical protein [Tanacetum cinerariifolium]